MFLVNSRLSLRPAAPSRCSNPGHFLPGSTLAGHPFSRSYGVNLPSSLTEDRSSTFGEFPVPTSVGVRYGHSVGLPSDLHPRGGEWLFWAAWGYVCYHLLSGGSRPPATLSMWRGFAYATAP